MKISNVSANYGTKITDANLRGNEKHVFINPVLDSVSFNGKTKQKKFDIDFDLAHEVTHSLSSSTSGHRAVYGSSKFDDKVVTLFTLGVAKYAKDTAKKQGIRPVVLIGGDTRKATKKSLPLIKDILLSQGVDVLFIKKPVPTPTHALFAKSQGINIAVLMTASHNPWQDGGFNLVTKEGAIAPPSVTAEVAKNSLMYAKKGYYTMNKDAKSKISEIFPYKEYKNALNDLNLIDWQNIKNSDISIYYDGLEGTGLNVLPKLLKDYGININKVNSGKKEGPNPTKENLVELSEKLNKDKNYLKIGLATDGDADRFGVIDEKGNFIPPNDIILLSAYHLAKNKGKTGAIIRSQATSSQLDLFAKNNGIKVIQTPVGFKYIAEDIIEERKHGRDILVAGEESGGLTVNAHIPEKDGIIALLLMLDLVASEKKPLSQILENVKNNLGTNFRAQAFNKKLETEEDKALVMNRMKEKYQSALDGFCNFGDFQIDINTTKANMEEMERYKKGGDGIKLYFTDGSSILVRKSGTEPKIKAYIETYNDSSQIADENTKKLKQELDKIFEI